MRQNRREAGASKLCGPPLARQSVGDAAPIVVSAPRPTLALSELVSHISNCDETRTPNLAVYDNTPQRSGRS